MRRTRLLLPVLAAALALPLVATAAPGSKAPAFQVYTSPSGVDLYTGIPQPLGDVVEDNAPFGVYTQTGLGDGCGEPTLAVHPKTGDVLYQCGLQTLRVSKMKNGKATWTPVQPLVESVQSSDPILRHDTDTGRVFTYDRGRTWKTYDTTPKSPVQVGSICTGGLSCDGDRNLLDFNDMVIDGKGRVVVAFADGCLKDKGCTTRDRLKKGAFARQESGRSLYREFD